MPGASWPVRESTRSVAVLSDFLAADDEGTGGIGDPVSIDPGERGGRVEVDGGTEDLCRWGRRS